jgi:hypothetical protein
VVSGLLSLSRNLGLITGAAAMGAVFAVASSAADVAVADPAAVARGLHAAFGVAAGLVGIALVVAAIGHSLVRRSSSGSERQLPV